MKLAAELQGRCIARVARSRSAFESTNIGPEALWPASQRAPRVQRNLERVMRKGIHSPGADQIRTEGKGRLGGTAGEMANLSTGPTGGIGDVGIISPGPDYR
jgi:hypothetical protein